MRRKIELSSENSFLWRRSFVIQKPIMRMVQLLIFFGWVALGSINVLAGIYKLTDGQTLSGEPISFNDEGVVLREGGDIKPRASWATFTQESLKQLLAEAKTRKEAAFIEPFIEELRQEKARQKEIILKPVPRVERPAGRTGLLLILTSPIGLVLFFVLYLANIYAAYEIAIFRRQPRAVVCVSAAAVPLFGPLICLFLPAHVLAMPPEPATVYETPTLSLESSAAPDVSDSAETTQPPSAPAYIPPPPPSQPSSHPRPTVSLPTGAPIAPTPPAVSVPAATSKHAIYQRGQFTFNRRFFETKVPGFFRVVPSETDRDLLLFIKSSRGEFLGKRITSITQTELVLQIFKENVTADEMIPFNEIQEVQVQPKDVT